MGIDFQEVKAQADLIGIIGSFIPLTQRGPQEYLARCPFHEDRTASFTVNIEKRIWHCFGACHEGGDVIDFVQRMTGSSLTEAVELIAGKAGRWKALPIRPGLKPAAQGPSTRWIHTVPPAGLMPESLELSGLGKPVAFWEYLLAERSLIGIVARYEVEVDGVHDKTYRQWTYGANETETPKWACRNFTRPRPIYGLEVLASYPDRPVMIVEGEKACEAARVLFPSYNCLTWAGGSNAVEAADWSAVHGQSCTVIPDADEAGAKAADLICATLSANGCTLSRYTHQDGVVKGWDLADALADNWTSIEAARWLQIGLEGYEPHAEVATTEERPAPAAFSEDALAHLMAAQISEDWRYVAAWKQWLVWQDYRWTKDETDFVRVQGRDLCRQAVNWEQGALLTESAKRKINSLHTISAITTIVGFEPAVAARPDQWDTDSWLLATPGGVVDLRSGVAHPARRTDYQIRSTAVAPSHDPCPNWLTFLNTVMAGDQEVIGYLQRLAGYALTGVTTEQHLTFFYGTGGNGKGVFLNTLRGIMGDYAMNAPMATFTETTGERHETELAGLKGSRLVVAQETDEGRKWAEARIKALTGGDPIRARFMKQDYFEFVPNFKLVFAGNHKPSLRSVDEAMRRRMHIVPWTVTITAEQRDLDLTEKLKAEYGGILRWMIDGCRWWQVAKLSPPAVILAATDEYLESEDGLLAWLEEHCILGAEQVTETRVVYQSYVEYCESMKEHPWSHRRLTSNLLSRGGISVGRKGSIRALYGIGLKPVIVGGSATPSWRDFQ